MKVSIAVVAYNEESTLPRLLKDVAAQDYPHDQMEVLLIDSMSRDRTWQLMKEFEESNHDFARVVVLKNPNKILPFGCNVALENYTGDAIVRIDAHASIPADFISKNVAVLNSGEFVSGGPRPNIIDGESSWKKTLLAAEQSMFGSSIASYRRSESRKYVSSIFHGMYRREVYDAAGPYNVHLTRTEDNDMSQRIIKAGYRLCYDPSIVSYQHTRPSLKLMLRQKYLNGYWIGMTMGINPRCFSLFHFVPLAFVLGILATTVLALFGWPLLAGLMWSLYACAVVVFTALDMIGSGFSGTKLLLPAIFLGLHVSYGVGTLVGLIKMPFWSKKVRREEAEKSKGD